MCDQNGFEFKTSVEQDATAPTMEELLATIPEQQRVVRTDGGTEFAGMAVRKSAIRRYGGLSYHM